MGKQALDCHKFPLQSQTSYTNQFTYTSKHYSDCAIKCARFSFKVCILHSLLLFSDPNKDFVVGPSTTIELTELGSRQCINISIVNDDLRERNETFIVTPVPLDSDDVVVGGPFTAVILDDGDGEKLDV